MRVSPLRLLAAASLTGACVQDQPVSPGAIRASPPAAAYSHYDLKLAFDLGRAVMKVDADWILPAEKEAKRTWTFFVSPLMRMPRISRLSCGGGALAVTALTGSTRSEGETDQLWRLSADKDCPAGSRLRIALTYESDRSSAPQFRIDTNRGFAGSGGELWYPQLAHSQLDTGRISLSLPHAMRAIATGAFIARRVRQEETEWLFETARPAKLAFAFGPYQEGNFRRPLPVRVLTTTGEAEARAVAQGLAGIFGPLTAAFGPPPQPGLSLVEIDFQSRVLGTSEHGMIFADSSKFRERFDLAYWAHEFGHQWWGNAVRTSDGTEGRSLFSEGLAQYGALVAIEAVRGPAAAAAYRKSAGGKDTLQAYSELIAQGRDRPLAGPVPGTQEEVLLAHRLATSKGAILLDQLSRMIGRARFHALLRSFVASHIGRKTSWAELEAHIEAGTGEAYSWWFDQWLRRAGAPDLEASHRIEGNRVKVEIRQKGDQYRLSIPLEIRGRWGRRRFAVELSGAGAVRDYEAPGPIEMVTIDPDGLLPRRNFKP